MLDANSKETVHLRGNWSEEELQRAFDKIKFANCSVDAVSKEHGIPRRTLKGLLDFFINQNLLISEVGVITLTYLILFICLFLYFNFCLFLLY